MSTLIRAELLKSNPCTACSSSLNDHPLLSGPLCTGLAARVGVTINNARNRLESLVRVTLMTSS